ncbi:MAG: hypothetical protein GY756_16475 [bacterium]|nr:hypothetical protein [bacterium]
MKNKILYISTVLIACLTFGSYCFAAKATTTWPAKALVGYEQNLNYNSSAQKTPLFADAISHNYNVIVYAFGTVGTIGSQPFGTNTQGDTVGLFNNSWNDNGYAPYKDQDALKTAINEAHSKGAKVLLSFGSSNANLWMPNTTANDAKKIADNMIVLLVANHFDGVDLDLELSAYKNTAWLETLITELKTKAAKIPKSFPYGFFVTAAPQMQNDGTLNWNTPGNNNIMDLINGNYFTAIFIQNYNNSAGLTADKVFDNVLDKITDPTTNKTKILICMPATSSAASTGYILPGEVNSELLRIADDHFGGLAVWDLSYDNVINFVFSKNAYNGIGIN